jgi:hypothetical protein
VSAAAGLRVVERWVDAAQRFSVNLLAPQDA